MRGYRVLTKNRFAKERYTLVPIRDEDKFLIMRWRNEQMNHLRQTEQLTVEKQIRYFETVIDKLFDVTQPSQLLFSFLEDGNCIGYGGLVHINWIDKNAEISFIMDSTLESSNFDKNWSTYLELIEEVAFKQIAMHKLFVYAFDLRPYLYTTLESNGYQFDARLKEHCVFQDQFLDVVIHYKLNKQ